MQIGFSRNMVAMPLIEAYAGDIPFIDVQADAALSMSLGVLFGEPQQMPGNALPQVVRMHGKRVHHQTSAGDITS